MVTSYDLFVVLIGLERLLELKISAFNRKLAFARGGIEIAPKHFVIMRILHVGLLLGCVIEPRLTAAHFVAPFGYVWLAVALAAQILRYSCIWALGPAWNVRIIVVPGEAAKRRGVYRYLRHPNYLAVVIDGIAIPLIGGCVITASIFTISNALLLWWRIRCEQRALFTHLKGYEQVGRA